MFGYYYPYWARRGAAPARRDSRTSPSRLGDDAGEAAARRERMSRIYDMLGAAGVEMLAGAGTGDHTGTLSRAAAAAMAARRDFDDRSEESKRYREERDRIERRERAEEEARSERRAEAERAEQAVLAKRVDELAAQRALSRDALLRVLANPDSSDEQRERAGVLQANLEKLDGDTLLSLASRLEEQSGLVGRQRAEESRQRANIRERIDLGLRERPDRPRAVPKPREKSPDEIGDAIAASLDKQRERINAVYAGKLADLRAEAAVEPPGGGVSMARAKIAALENARSRDLDALLDSSTDARDDRAAWSALSEQEKEDRIGDIILGQSSAWKEYAMRRYGISAATAAKYRLRLELRK